jgi:hypothetical protein
MARTIPDQGSAEQDANEALVYEFDYDDNLAAGVQLSSVGTFAASPNGLTLDQSTLAVDGRSVTVRVAGGVRGRVYEVRHTAGTNETPVQTKSKWFKLRIT